MLFGIRIEKIKEVIPPAPTNPFIDLGQFKEHRVEEAILRSFNPEVIDQALRANPHHSSDLGQRMIIPVSSMLTKRSKLTRKNSPYSRN